MLPSVAEQSTSSLPSSSPNIVVENNGQEPALVSKEISRMDVAHFRPTITESRNPDVKVNINLKNGFLCILVQRCSVALLWALYCAPATASKFTA